MENKDFLAFWGWNTLPWNVPPAVDQLFWQRSTLDTAKKLMTSMQRSNGIFVLGCPPGHGKTTLIRWLHHQLSPASDDVALFALSHDEHDSAWILDYLATYLGLDAHCRIPEIILDKLSQSMLRKRPLTLLIDEAHRLMQPAAFEGIQALLQTKDFGSLPINFVLIGHPQLIQKLQGLDSLAHRIHYQDRIQSFSSLELGQFVRYYLQRLGLSAQTLTLEAHSLLSQQEFASFASIENILESCLIGGFLKQQRIIQPELVQESLKTLLPSKVIGEVPKNFQE